MENDNIGMFLILGAVGVFSAVVVSGDWMIAVLAIAGCWVAMSLFSGS